MRRTVRALSLALLTGAVLGGGAPAALADPSAEVNPGTAEAGGSVSVSVSCDPVGGPAPETLDAASRAFDQGTVQLTRVPAADDEVSGPEYRGTARLTATAGDTGDGTGAGGGDDGSGTAAADGPDTAGPDTVPEPAGTDAVPQPVGPDASGPGAVTTDAVVGGPAWTVDGTCPAAAGEQGQPWSTTFAVARGDGHQTAGDTGDTGDTNGIGGTGDTGGTGGIGDSGYTGTASCPKPRSDARTPAPPHPTPTTAPAPDGGSCTPVPTRPVPPVPTPAPVQHGVAAGAGSAPAPSVPALVTGAALIAAALGGATYRLRRKGVRRNG
jgi:hypothetical protein